MNDRMNKTDDFPVSIYNKMLSAEVSNMQGEACTVRVTIWSQPVQRRTATVQTLYFCVLAGECLVLSPSALCKAA